MNKLVILLLVTVLTALLIPAKLFLLAGIFLGLTWFPARMLIFANERRLFCCIFEANYIPLDDQIDRKSAFAMYVIINFVINFFIMLLVWPGMMVNSCLCSGGGTRETRS